jgi:hypothetical protein
LPQILGIPLIAYITYTAAIAVATVRAAEGSREHLLTGMLAWSGVFGLGAGAYYMGASMPAGVPTLFPPWAFSLALLAVVAIRHMARNRAATLPALAVLFCVGLLGTFVLRPPARLAPWSQIARIGARLPPGAPLPFAPFAAPRDPAFERFVREVADGKGHFVIRDDAPVALFSSTGHLIAEAYRLRDVVPYTGESVFTVEQLDAALRRLQAAGGTTLFVPTTVLSRVSKALLARGFAVMTVAGFTTAPGSEPLTVKDGLTKWVDARVLPSADSQS